MQPGSHIFVFFAGLALLQTGALAQSIDGKVELPKQSAGSPLGQRYENGPDSSGGSFDPPMAVVYLEGAPSRNEGSAAHPFAEVAQKNISFTPTLLAIQVGTTVEFPNLDDTYHNVFSYSKTKRFDLGRYRKEEKPGTVLFDKPGVVTLHCEVHSAMRGTILVLDTPYFEKTNTRGEFHLRNLPTGHYLLKAWVTEDDQRTQWVDLKPGVILHVDFPGR